MNLAKGRDGSCGARLCVAQLRPQGRSLRPGPLQPIVRPVGGSCSSPLRCDLRLHVGVGGRELTVGQVQTGYELGEPFMEVDNWVNSCSERVVSTALSF